MNRKSRIFMGDFETTVYPGQTDTEVWAAACVELGTEDVQIFHSIGEQLDYLISLDCNVIIYYHNLKFDGSFWLSHFIIDRGYRQAATQGETANSFEFIEPKQMKDNTFSYSISDMGQWYRIILKVKKHYIEIRDSLKLLPFSVKRIGNSFGTKHKKLEMEYKGFRYAGCNITDEEKEYIANDVLVVKEALEIMFAEGHKKLTIGSCCLAEYRNIISKTTFNTYFPNIYEIPLDPGRYGVTNAGEYIRRSYRGGWCYLVKGKEQRIFHHGVTADVNSLYPSMMSSESGNFYPIGEPNFWHGDYIPDEALKNKRYYFVRVRTRFYIKPGKLPFIQMKGNLLYRSTEMLETSDIYNHKDGRYYNCYYDQQHNLRPAIVTMTLTMTDYILMREHYDLVDFEILDGCWFESAIGIFDEYIEKYKKIKLESKGALRELAKLFLNNLYGKMASSTDSSFKVAFRKEDDSIGFYDVTQYEKQPGFIPVGSAITSYARNFTIRAAQKNYYGVDQPGFIYADTDSIHCDLAPEDFQGITVHPKNFCCWKQEASWDVGWFVRQKTYIEHVIAEDLQPIDHPYYNIKCAGMPDKCKQLFVKSMEGYTPQDGDEYSEEEREFLKEKRTVEDFTQGLTVPGKLMPKRIKGGVLLTETTYQLR